MISNPGWSTVEHWYGASRIIYGPDCVRDKLGKKLAEWDVERALVVCGSNVGSNNQVMTPVLEGIGNRLVGVFDETTPKRSVQTVFNGIEQIHENNVDMLVSVGGGSSIDITRSMSVVEAEHDKELPELFADISEGRLVVPELTEMKLPIISIPTTLSGAEVTPAAGMDISPITGELPGRGRKGPIVDTKIWPKAIFYDPKLGITTPKNVIAASGMNGFDHAIEVIYSRNATPMTDATAAHSLRLLRKAFPATIQDPKDEQKRLQAMLGVVLGTYGLVDPFTQPKFSIIHAFGHKLAQRYSLQQGLIHGVVAPHVLQFVFDNHHGRRDLLADALSVQANSDGELAQGIISAVTDVRDDVGLPARLRDLEGIEQSHFRELATAIVERDIGILFRPSGLEISKRDAEAVLEAAW